MCVKMADSRSSQKVTPKQSFISPSVLADVISYQTFCHFGWFLSR